VTRYEELAALDGPWLKEYGRRYDQTTALAGRLVRRFLTFLEVPESAWVNLNRRADGDFEPADRKGLEIFPDGDGWYSFGVQIDFFPPGTRGYFSISVFIFRARMIEDGRFKVQLGKAAPSEITATDDGILAFCEMVYQGLKQDHDKEQRRIGFHMPSTKPDSQ
jgi:hypothetical protein